MVLIRINMFVPGLISLATILSSVSALNTTKAKPIIIDTDFFSDVDDVGALAIANVLHNCGLCDLQGVVIDTPSKYGALAASVRPHPSLRDDKADELMVSQGINTYFGNGEIPIGALRPLTNETFSDSYLFT